MAEKMDRERQDFGGSAQGNTPVEGNLLLNLVPAKEMDQIQPHLEQVDVAFRQQIYTDGGSNEFAYFPQSGVLSMVSLPHDEKGLLVEVATIGREGMVGLPLLLGGSNMPGECFCQVAGQAARVPAEKFQNLVGTLPGFRRVLLRYTQALFTLIAQG